MWSEIKIALFLKLFVGTLVVGVMLTCSPDLHGQCIGNLIYEEIACKTSTCQNSVTVQIPTQFGGPFYGFDDPIACCNILEPNYDVIGYCAAPVKESPAEANQKTRETYAWIRGCDGRFYLTPLPV